MISVSVINNKNYNFFEFDWFINLCIKKKKNTWQLLKRPFCHSLAVVYIREAMKGAFSATPLFLFWDAIN